MIINGKPYTNENGWEDKDLLDKFTKEEQEKILSWVKENFIPRKTVNKNATSYGLKHVLEHDLQIYLTNNQFKDAMMQSGYYPLNSNDLNWYYYISQKSPALKK